MESLKATAASNAAGSLLGKSVCVALTLAALTAAGIAPALATTYHHYRYHHVALPSRPLQMYAGQAFADDVPSGVPIDMKRATAVHECSVLAAKFSNASWETAQLANYGACMTEHG